MLDCPDPNLVSPTDSGKNTVKLTQEGVECRQSMVKSKKEKDPFLFIAFGQKKVVQEGMSFWPLTCI